MATDDLDAPLGRNGKKKQGFKLPFTPLQAVTGILGCVVFGFVLWIAFANDPYGGEPMAVATTEIPNAATQKSAPGAANIADSNAPAGAHRRYDGPDAAAAAKSQANTQTITIIDGSSGKKQEVVIAAPTALKDAAPVDQRLLENSRHGMIPKIGADGTRPAEAYAVAAKNPLNNPDGPRVALIVNGLGVSANATADALSKLPAPVTLAFTPYGTELESSVGRARAQGHEVLLQIPMEPFDYPDNDPGPQTLLTSLSPEQNIDRLHWLLSRFQGFVGIENFMGARFTATEASLAPILRETAKRGLIYVDDGSSARSLTGQIAGANKIPFAKPDVVIDAVPTKAEIDKALARLEAMARERGYVTGIAAALPATIDRVAKWAKAAAGRGIVIVPISAVTAKPKSS